jgi:hypothetical protein
MAPPDTDRLKKWTPWALAAVGALAAGAAVLTGRKDSAPPSSTPHGASPASPVQLIVTGHVTAADYDSMDDTWRNGVSTVAGFPALYVRYNPGLRPGDILQWPDGTRRTVREQQPSPAGVGHFNIILDSTVDAEAHGFPMAGAVLRSPGTTW